MSGSEEAIAELRRLQEDMLYTEKAHFRAAGRARVTHYALGGCATVTAAAAAVSVVADGAPVVAGALALISTMAAALVTFLKPEELAQQHLAAGRDLGSIRVEARQVMCLDVPSVGVTGDVRSLIGDLAARKAAVDRASPPLSDRSFEHGRKKIEAGHFEHEARS